ncbi:DUF4924 family protein [Porphyromonas pogonae]|uniref:DUF4924 family protein n=1 Tax=Porphyromonas pogonae TaxID=867595 RepID=UPI002E79E6CA|nr:DUF4924 family protein [Porphyromonas pogonae]
MIIARKKRKENISEYLLYMWQVEDLIRAADCNMDNIRKLILNRYEVDEPTRQEIETWYQELTDMMLTEGVRESGHLNINRIVMMELEDLSKELLADPKQTIYTSLYYQVLPAIIQLREKNGGNNAGEIETCFNAVYGYLTLRLQNKLVSEDTQKSIKQISTFLAMLADRFKHRDDVIEEE